MQTIAKQRQMESYKAMVQEELELLRNPPVEEIVLNVDDVSLAGE